MFFLCCGFGLVCYAWSFCGFLMLCRFMEWNFTFGLDTAKLFGTEPPSITFHSLLNTLIHMDWSIWWEETNVLVLICYVISGLIILGLMFMAVYVPYKVFVFVVPERMKDKNYKLAKFFALLLSLLSHPVIWYVCIHYGETLAGIAMAIISTGVIFVICYYIGMFCIATLLSPVLGAASVAASAIDATSSKQFNLSSIPVIVYDDSNRQWKRRGIFGDHAVYYNSDGDEVTIYSTDVSGNSANTSAGNLHWY